jgi:hypothetical protein
MENDKILNDFLYNECYQCFKKRRIKLKKKENSGYRESQIVLTKNYEILMGEPSDAYLCILYLKREMNLLRKQYNAKIAFQSRVEWKFFLMI